MGSEGSGGGHGGMPGDRWCWCYKEWQQWPHCAIWGQWNSGSNVRNGSCGKSVGGRVASSLFTVFTVHLKYAVKRTVITDGHQNSPDVMTVKNQILALLTVQLWPLDP